MSRSASRTWFTLTPLQLLFLYIIFETFLFVVLYIIFETVLFVGVFLLTRHNSLKTGSICPFLGRFYRGRSVKERQRWRRALRHLFNIVGNRARLLMYVSSSRGNWQWLKQCRYGPLYQSRCSEAWVCLIHHSPPLMEVRGSHPCLRANERVASCRESFDVCSYCKFSMHLKWTFIE